MTDRRTATGCPAGPNVPSATVLVDTPDAIATSFDIVDELTAEHGLVTSEMVPAMLALDGGIDGAAPGWRGTDTDRVSLALAYLAVYRPTPWSRLVRPR